jgi:hypothetical protein
MKCKMNPEIISKEDGECIDLECAYAESMELWNVEFEMELAKLEHEYYRKHEL